MGLLEIRNKQFRLHTTRFTQNRIFIYEDISLSAIESLQPHDPKIEEKIHKVLVDKVEKMLTEAKQVHTTQLTTTTDDDGQVETAPLYRIRSPDQYLIRLRVEHSGYPSLNQNRFGANFVGRIANPSEMLLFSKKKKEYQPRAVEGKSHRERKQQQDVDDGEEDEGIHKIKIDDLVCESLRNSKRPLSLLVEASLTQALDEFILKKDSGSIPDLVEETLNNTRKVLFGEVLADTKDKIIEYVSRHKKTTEDSIARGEAAAVPRCAPRPYDDDDDEDNEDEGDETKVKPKATAAKGGAKTKAVPAPKPKAKPRKKTEDSDDESVEKKAPKRRRAAKV
jgi:double-strand break repair protein MRE11